jgi:hypothetical protein
MALSTRRQSLIVREWDRWSTTRRLQRYQATRKETLEFFLELQNAKSPLLDFNPRGRDKWEIVHRWLVIAGRASNDEQPAQ